MARRIIQTGITKEMLNGDNQPQIQILDKLYVVDDRQKTFDKIQAMQADSKLSDREKEDAIYELALGKEAFKEIQELGLSVSAYRHFTFCVMAAITDEDPDKLEKAAKEQQGKN